MQTNVYQHFRKDEHSFIDLVYNWVTQVETMYAPVETDFLNPRERFILETLVRSYDEIEYSFWGGKTDSERQCAMIYPSYYEINREDYGFSFYEIDYPQKFGTLSHPKILGSLMNTGIKRELIGDIITDGTRWQFAIKDSIANYSINQIEKIGRLGVKVYKISDDELVDSIEEWIDETITVSSLRIDNIIASVYNISRQRAKVAVESNKVKINWVEVDRVDYAVNYLDIISIKGFGRIQLMDEMGKTKKEKIRLNIKVFRK